MRLELTKSFRSLIRNQLMSLIFELLDGDIDAPEQFASTLETIAAEVRRQNKKAESDR